MFGRDPNNPNPILNATDFYRLIAERFLACESCGNALSQAISGGVAGADFPVVFWNARAERVDVPRTL